MLLNTPGDHSYSAAAHWVIEKNPGPYGKKEVTIPAIRIATLNVRGARLDKIERVIEFMYEYQIPIMVITEAKRWTEDLNRKIRSASL